VTGKNQFGYLMGFGNLDISRHLYTYRRILSNNLIEVFEKIQYSSKSIKDAGKCGINDESTKIEDKLLY
jgi:hypothetical protein